MKVKANGKWGIGLTRFKRQGAWLKPRSTWQKHNAKWLKVGVNYYRENYKLRHYATGMSVAQLYDPNTTLGLNAFERKLNGRDCVDFINAGWIKMTDLKLPAQWTINLWYHARSLDGYQHFFTYSGNQTNFTFKLSPTYPGRPYIHFNGNSYRAPDAIGATGWHMLTLSYDGSNYRIYINGVLSLLQASNYKPPLGNYLCGSINEEVGGEKNVGLVSDFVIYSKLLSQSEVTELYTNW